MTAARKKPARRKARRTRTSRPEPRTSVDIDQKLADRALAKRDRGESITQAERAALRRIEKRRADEQRRQLLEALPQKAYRELTGIHPQVLKDIEARHGIPVTGRTIDVGAVLRAFHDLLDEFGPMILRSRSRHRKL